MAASCISSQTCCCSTLQAASWRPSWGRSISLRFTSAAVFWGGWYRPLVAHSAGASHRPLIGASAGVFAVLIAFTTILPELELTCLLFFVIPIRIRARNLALLLTGSTVLFILFPYLNNLGNHMVDALSPTPVVVAHYAHLGGCILGWLYVKQLGYGNPWRIQRYFFEKRQLEERRKHMTAEQFIVEEIDPILEKISRDGIRSLTRNERRILNMGREKMGKPPLS